MSSEILRGDATDVAEPMPWLTAPGTGGPPLHGLYEAPPKVSKADAAEFDARIAAARAAGERAAQEARETGRREGDAAGRRAAQADVQKAVEQLGSALRQVAELRPRLRLEAEADLVKLALEIARRVVRRELSIDPEAILGLARTALERLRLEETVRVRMHPHFQESVRQFLQRTPGAGHVEITPDATLDRGAIVFETARGRLDASAETQFREIESGLTDRLRAYGV